ncbi:MAG: tetratricopeptide repeat protein [Zoogloea sp.]|nr:MAG: tetratricopeptide repeat protein [Zoogloea sp.]
MAGGVAGAAEPSLHQVYQAAEAGRFAEAQAMMKQVLAAHPGSGKAHYVEAELLARQGQADRAAAELQAAERLAPGLPFARPEAVQALRGLVGGHPKSSVPGVVQPAIQTSPGQPWGVVAAGLGLIAFIILAARFMSRRNLQTVPQGGVPAGASGWPAAAPVPASTSYGGGAWPAAEPAPAQPGLGSRVLGGLATGAAVGAGMVAGEALMHRFMDGRDRAASPAPPAPPARVSDDVPPGLDLGTPVLEGDDMGGADFGISDAGSWDDGGSSRDSDWN